MSHAKHVMPELSSGSMADIAFLLLTFYMMTTVIKDNKGLALMLPPHLDIPQTQPIHDRNLFTIRINSKDKIMVEGAEVEFIHGTKEAIKEFILNNGRNRQSSDSPDKAVVSIKTDRGTSYRAFIETLDEVQAAYYDIYAERAHITSAAFRSLDLSKTENKRLYDQARHGIPMNISIAEPGSVSN